MNDYLTPKFMCQKAKHGLPYVPYFHGSKNFYYQKKTFFNDATLILGGTNFWIHAKMGRTV